MIRKIFKTGHSLAITISKKSLKDLGWHEGDGVDVVVDAVGKKITISHKKKQEQLSLQLHSRQKLGSKLNL